MCEVVGGPTFLPFHLWSVNDVFVFGKVTAVPGCPWFRFTPVCFGWCMGIYMAFQEQVENGKGIDVSGEIIEWVKSFGL